ncbi:hypothetical protein GC098_21825 [Paenibacillus sp. LMG 31458]|uniref:Uncharacterized protein n=1 Tax=Paenibacillus phytorum TaxID=2654977 RepID=A0ABX1XZH9_9BACL|nr:hypothetical protein [Paenibacillus phytorum]NOU74005.1 hypothetical protein [Paenibacillus phytorum]
MKAYDAVGDDNDGFARYGGAVVYVEDAEYGVEDDASDDDACNDDVGSRQRGDASDGKQDDAWDDRHDGVVGDRSDGVVGDRRDDDVDGEDVYNEHVRDVDALDNALPVLLKAADGEGGYPPSLSELVELDGGSPSMSELVEQDGKSPSLLQLDK